MDFFSPENKKGGKSEDEIDAMEVGADWPESKGEWICEKTGERARVNPLDQSIVGCLSCKFWTRHPAKTGHFKVKKVSGEQRGI